MIWRAKREHAGADVSDAWKLYDELIDAIPDGVTVTAGTVGMRWCRVICSEGGLGIAYTMPEQSRPTLYDRSTYAGASLGEIAALAKSWNLAEAGIGMAAINAWYASSKLVAENGFTRSEASRWAQVFDPYSQEVAGKVVSVIGHFPFAPASLGAAAELRMLERTAQSGDYPDSACEYLLPDSDYVFISGSAFVNKTIPRLLQLAENATTIVLGPSTPLSPVLFEHGVDAITGFVAASPTELSDSLGGLTIAGMYEYGYRVERSRENDGA